MLRPVAKEFDVASVLRAARADGALLRFVEEFAAAFARPIDDCDGFGELELREAEERIGVRVPSALREAYLVFGRRADLTRSQDPLLPPSRLRLDVTNNVLVFRAESQACASWGIALDALDRDDPPVLVDHAPDRGSRWSPFIDRTSLAVLDLVLSETTLGGGRELRDMCEVSSDELPNILTGYSRLELPDYPNPGWAEYMPIRWYSAPGRLLRVDAETESFAWLVARGRRRHDLKAMVREIRGRWMFAGESS